MQTTYELALNEFRDASANVRRQFGAVAEARELQIIADSQHKAASNGLADAQDRLDRADRALTAAREVPKTTPAIEANDEPPATQATISRLFGADPAANGADDTQLSIG